MRDEYGRLRELRKGGGVRRFHVEPMIGEQTVAAHSFHMAVMALAFWPDCSVNLLTAILYHDLAECRVGDTPAPAKRNNPALWDALHAAEAKADAELGLTVPLTEEDTRRVALVDALESCCFGVDQIRLGNQQGFTMLRNGISYVKQQPVVPQAVKDFLGQLCHEVHMQQAVPIPYFDLAEA